MIGLRRTSGGLWVHGATLPWNELAQIRGSCAAIGGHLRCGPIGVGPMYGCWCCGKWGCTDAWRPDHARGGGMGALGQAKVPFQNAIEQAVRALNAPDCISSKQLLPIVEKSLAFASEQTPYAFSFYRLAPGAEISRLRGDMQRAMYQLQYWRDRFATETERQYCKGYTVVDGQNIPSQDRWLITQAIAVPYQVASGIAGAKDTLADAGTDFVNSITLDIAHGGPWWLQLKYLGPIALAAIAFGIYSRVKGAPPSEEAGPEVGPSRSEAPVSSKTFSAALAPVSAPVTSAAPPPPRKPKAPAQKSTSSVSGSVASEWAEYKRRLAAGEPRDGRRVRRRMRRSMGGY